MKVFAPASLLVLGTLAGCGAGASAPGRPAATGTAAAIIVDALPAEREPVARTLSALGSIEAVDRVILSPEIDGIVRSIDRAEGETVTVGAGEAPVLCRLETEILELELAQAEAALGVARADLAQRHATFERKAALHDERAVTEAVYTDARLARDRATAVQAQAEARLGQARAQLARATLRAPMSGVLGERFVSPGAYVRKGDKLLELVRLDPLEVAFAVNERHRAELREGLDCEVAVAAWPERTFRGPVTYVAPAADPRARSLRLKARLDNPDGALRPGFFARVRLVLAAAEAAIVIPEQAVVPRGEGFLVYIVDGGVARRREVRLGQRLPGRVAVVEGLDGSEQIIVAGLQRVSDGAAVTVRPPAPPR